MNKKKKTFIILLLLFVFISVGYGAYSYYMVKNDLTQYGYIHSDVVFSVNISDDYYSEGLFVSNGNSIEMECSEFDSTGHSTCTGTMYVINTGTVYAYVEIKEPKLISEISFDYSGPNLSWTSTSLSPGETQSLVVTLYLYDPSKSNEPTFASDYIYYDFSDEHIGVKIDLSARS